MTNTNIVFRENGECDMIRDLESYRDFRLIEVIPRRAGCRHSIHIRKPNPTDCRIGGFRLAKVIYLTMRGDLNAERAKRIAEAHRWIDRTIEKERRTEYDRPCGDKAIEDLPDFDFEAEQFMQLSPASLDLIDADEYRLPCACGNCTRTTRVRDYGVSPWFRVGRRWWNLDQLIFFCAKHWPAFKRARDRGDGEKFVADYCVWVPSIERLIKK